MYGGEYIREAHPYTEAGACDTPTDILYFSELFFVSHYLVNQSLI